MESPLSIRVADQSPFGIRGLAPQFRWLKPCRCAAVNLDLAFCALSQQPSTSVFVKKAMRADWVT